MKNILEDLIKESKINKLKKSEIIKGKIININNNFVIIDTGLKSESKISITEFTNIKDKLNINDEIDILLDDIQNVSGETIISYEKAEIKKKLNKIETCYLNNTSIIGEIINKIKGGYEVSINNITAFLPGSLNNITNIDNGQKIELKIVKFDKSKTNIVVTTKLEDDEDDEDDLNSFFSIDQFYIGQHVTGTIKNITNYGAFVTLGKIDGLVHITDISWKRIKHPQDVLKLHEKVNLIVLKIDLEQEKLYLGIKQLTPNPWEEIHNKYPKGYLLNGKITNLTNYGIFVEIEPGIEGLVHNSYLQKNKIKKDELIIDQVIQVSILNVDVENKKISLNINNNQNTEKPRINNKILNFFLNKNYLIETTISSYSKEELILKFKNNFTIKINQFNLNYFLKHINEPNILIGDKILIGNKNNKKTFLYKKK